MQLSAWHRFLGGRCNVNVGLPMQKVRGWISYQHTLTAWRIILHTVCYRSVQRSID
jgi:hypothetical protein